MDVAVRTNPGFAIAEIYHASAESIAAEINEILGLTANPSRSSSDHSTVQTPPEVNTMRVVADERTSKVIVHGSDEAKLAEILRLIGELDVKVD